MLSRNGRLLLVLFGAVLILCIQGCGSARIDAEAPDAAPGAMGTALVPEDAFSAGGHTVEYRLRIGDRIEVGFLVDGELDFTTPVTPSGTVSVPLAGEIMAAGKTTGELSRAVEEAMGDYLLDPTVTIVIAGIADQPIFVIGEVDKPGRIEATGEMTVTRALSAAGGILSSGKASSVMVVRTSGVEEPIAIQVDVRKVLNGEDFAEDIILVPNDVVYVPKSLIGKVNEFVDLFFDNIAPAQLFYLRGYNMAHLADDRQAWY